MSASQAVLAIVTYLLLSGSPGPGHAPLFCNPLVSEAFPGSGTPGKESLCSKLPGQHEDSLQHQPLPHVAKQGKLSLQVGLVEPAISLARPLLWAPLSAASGAYLRYTCLCSQERQQATKTTPGAGRRGQD